MSEEYDNELGIVPVKPKRKRGPQTKFLPQIEKPEYQEMYNFYEALGPTRSLLKVGAQFSKSKTFVALLARQFNWKLRLAQARMRSTDPIVVETKDQVDDSRKKLVAVVNEIADTLYELMWISKDIKRGLFDESREARSKQLSMALEMWGFSWKSPNQFKQLITTLREITEFNKGTEAVSKVHSATQINTETFELHIGDD